MKKHLVSKFILYTFRNYSVYITFTLVLIISGIVSRGIFIRPTNLWAILLRSSILGLVSLGQMLVIMTGGIDLSVGSLFSLSLTIMALGELASMNPYLAIALALGGGTLVGLANGVIVVTTNIYPFIVTFATMMMLESFNLTILGAAAFNFPTIQRALLSIMTFLHLDETILSVGIWAMATAVIFLLCQYSTFGHNLYAVGGNALASAFSGVNVKKVKVLSYTASGFLSALAAVMAAYRLGGTNVGAGAGYQLNSIAAAVVGGVSLYGGVGNPIGVAIGSIVVAMLLNIMNILNVDPFIQNAIQGLIILAYVAFSNYLQKIKIGVFEKQ
ncbi:MAG: ABC transporter permease [Candidatus Caldatribacteriaceae bacterium]